MLGKTAKFKKMVEKAIKDDYLSMVEAQAFFDYAKMHKIDFEDVQIVLAVYLRLLAHHITVNEEQFQIINQILEEMHIDDDVVPLMRAKLDDYLAGQVEQGIRALEPKDAPIILQDDEQCYYTLAVCTKKERTVAKKIRGGTVGVNLKVTQNISVNTGRFGGDVAHQTQYVADSSGYLVLTNQRLVYVSDVQNQECSWDNLLGYTVYDDGILINPRKGKSWKLYGMNDFSSRYVTMLIERHLQKN